MSPLHAQSLLLLLACLALLGPLTAAAQTYCSAPVLPFCVNRTEVYQDRLAAERCGDEVRVYAQKMRGYAECLQRQAAEAAGRADEVERRHACMQGGGENCR